MSSALQAVQNGRAIFPALNEVSQIVKREKEDAIWTEDLEEKSSLKTKNGEIQPTEKLIVLDLSSNLKLCF